MPLNYLSKSKYMHGIGCPRLLWYEINQSDSIPEPDSATQTRFDMGHHVGDLAKLLYPDGVEISWDNGFRQALLDTEEAIKSRLPIFEATFLYNSPAGPLLARTDLLIPVNGGKWDMVEVKSSSSFKDEYLDDVAFQLRVLDGVGIDVRRAYLMHLDREFRRHGGIDPREIFTKEDLTSEAKSLAGEVEARARQLFMVLESEKPPEIDLLGECGDFKWCDLSHVCWDWLPERHVGELYRGRNRALELMAQEIYRLVDIPDDYPLTDNQHIQKLAAQAGKPHIDPAEIRAFLEGLEYPLFAMDFETIQCAVPLFDGMGPWQQLPFQFSVHVQEKPQGQLRHHSFLADMQGGEIDPRPEFMDMLKGCLGSKGSILVYNESFEKKRLEEVAEAFPRYLDWVYHEVFPRVTDILPVFRSFAYYDPMQAGSASLKAVVPALLGSGYEDLEIADGGTASAEFIRISFGKVNAKEKAAVRRGLEVYCAKDTEVLFTILEVLKSILTNGRS